MGHFVFWDAPLRWHNPIYGYVVFYFIFCLTLGKNLFNPLSYTKPIK